jgi:hypothetical protein
MMREFAALWSLPVYFLCGLARDDAESEISQLRARLRDDVRSIREASHRLHISQPNAPNGVRIDLFAAVAGLIELDLETLDTMSRLIVGKDWSDDGWHLPITASALFRPFIGERVECRRAEYLWSRAGISASNRHLGILFANAPSAEKSCGCRADGVNIDRMMSEAEPNLEPVASDQDGLQPDTEGDGMPRLH